MALTKTKASASDGEITSRSTSLADARAGTGTLTVDAAGSNIDVGMWTASGTYELYEGFLSWSYPAVPSTHEVVTARVAARFSTTYGSVLRNIEFRLFTWGPSVAAGEWRSPAQFAALPAIGAVHRINSGVALFAEHNLANDRLLQRIRDNENPLQVVVATNRFRSQVGPTGDERTKLLSYNYVPTGGQQGDYAQQLTIGTMAKSALARIGPASIQTTDGITVFLDYTNSSLTLNYSVNGDDTNLIAELSSTTSGDAGAIDMAVAGWQTVSMCRDDSDNIFVVGKVGNAVNTIVVRAFKRGAGNSWSPWFGRTVAMPAYVDSTGEITNPGVAINNLTCGWHFTANLGHLMVVGAHHAGQGKSGQTFYASLSVNNMQAGVNPIASSGINPPWLELRAVNQAPGIKMTNDIGNALDLITWKGTRSGFVVMADGTDSSYQFTHGLTVGRYSLNANGSVSSGSHLPIDRYPVHQDLTPETKVKLVPCGQGRFAVCWGGHVRLYDYSGSLLGLGGIPLGTELTNYYESNAIDYVYDPATNQIWYYYVNLPAQREIARQPISLTTFQMGAREVVASDIGTGGDVVTGIRIARDVVNERIVRVDVAVRSSGGAHSVVVVRDSLNVKPNAPGLVGRPNFDATQPAEFSWTFSDVNTADGQTAYQLRVLDVPGGSVVYDSLKTSSTTSKHTVPGGSLSNDSSYQWQVRVWDKEDTPSDWSQLGAFQTLSTAITTITQPAEDNPTDATSSRYTVVWETTQITQARYRLTLVNTITGVTVLDTGWVVSTDNYRELTGLEDGITYRVTVWVRNNVDIESSPGTRLITPNYPEPPEPSVSVERGDSYILVSIENPEPEEGQSDPAYNDIWRAEGDGSEGGYTRIASVPLNWSYRDYAVRSGKQYTYVVEAVS